MSKNLKLTVTVNPEDHPDVDEYARQNGLGSANALLSAVHGELAKAKKKKLNLWHVLGRISADEEKPKQERLTERPALTESR